MSKNLESLKHYLWLQLSIPEESYYFPTATTIDQGIQLKEGGLPRGSNEHILISP